MVTSSPAATPASPATSSKRLGSWRAAAAASGVHTSSTAAPPWQEPGECKHLSQGRGGETGARLRFGWLSHAPSVRRRQARASARHAERAATRAQPGRAEAADVGRSPDVGIGLQRVVAQVDAGAPDVRVALHKRARVHEGEGPGHGVVSVRAAQLLRGARRGASPGALSARGGARAAPRQVHRPALITLRRPLRWRVARPVAAW